MATPFARFSLSLIMILVAGTLSAAPQNAGESMVDPGTARLQAAFSIIEHVAFETPMLEEWTDAVLGEALLLWDPGRGGHA